MAMQNEGVSQLLRALQAVLSESARPSRALRTILGQAVSSTGADRGVFVEIGQAGELDFRVRYRFQPLRPDDEAGRFSREVVRRALQSRKGVRLANAREDPAYRDSHSIQDDQVVSVLCVPILLDGEVRALVYLESRHLGHFTDEHQELLGSLAEVAAPTLAVLQAGEGVLRERDALRRSETRAREEARESRDLLTREWSFGRFVGRAPAVRELEPRIARAAAAGYPVLLSGETGTGKSILARILHHSSPRARRSFVTVFCPSLEKGMIEAELFGHRRGAFTGATADRAGKVQAAEGGTLFLDEVGELPLDLQPKLLRLLQERTYERLGDAREREADLWVLAATNRDLDEAVQQGRFRRDLFERLNYVPLEIPPLRDRREDIPLLLRHCLDRHPAGRWIELSHEAETFLQDLEFAWPGNVRHLEQLAARLVMEEASGPVAPADIRRLLGAAPAAGVTADASLEDGLPAVLALEERRWLEEALRRYPDLSRAELAAKLRISESALYKKLRSYAITSRP